MHLHVNRAFGLVNTPYILIQFTYVGSLSFVIGSLSTDDGDGNGNVRKSNIGLISKKNFARASHFFVHFFAVTLPLPREIPLCVVLLTYGHTATNSLSTFVLGIFLHDFISRDI